MISGFDLVLGVLFSLILGGICFFIHLQGLIWLGQIGSRIEIRPRRLKLSAALTAIMLIHIVEIALYGLSYWLAVEAGLGSIGSTNTVTQMTGTWTDYMYLAATVYTSLGFGDVVGTGVLAVIICLEALVGLILIAISVCFAYPIMENIIKRFISAE
ncbi:MAG: ion channel [Alphaproteobacteria bacterium]|nr:ion channel [Alphaproteobacteria bacterium]MDD9920233.1 ion channel [Alphaproteobacteria bacterium]